VEEKDNPKEGWKVTENRLFKIILGSLTFSNSGVREAKRITPGRCGKGRKSLFLPPVLRILRSASGVPFRVEPSSSRWTENPQEGA